MSDLLHFSTHRLTLLAMLLALAALGGAHYLVEPGFTASASAVAATNHYVVTTTADSGPGSLRQVITDNNNDPLGGGQISFNLLTSDPGYQAATGHWSIKPASALPAITKPVTIDGLTQPGASNATWPPTLKIELDGINAGAASGLGLSGGGAIVRGLVINRFGSDGITILSPGNQIECNYIGTDVTGTVARANGRSGVLVIAANNVIGGVTSDKRNLISANLGSGVMLNQTPANGNQVLGNYIGTNATGANPLGNVTNGILISSGAFNNAIGGNDPGAGNLIAFNATSNNGNGITVLQGTGGGNAIKGNSIHSNGGLGIELSLTFPFDGVTPNDANDDDAGPNNLQNFPVLTSVLADGSIVGSLDSAMINSAYPVRIEFFANAGCDPSRSGEGEVYLGFITLNAPGFFLTPAFTIPAGKPFITATATDANGNTSEFSPCASNIIVNPATLGDVMTGQSYTPVTFTATNAVGGVSFNLTAGSLPAGMSFNNSTAVLSGTPTQAGDFDFTVEATDQNNNRGCRDYTLRINSPFTAAGSVTDSGGGFGIAGVSMSFTLLSGSGAVPAAVITDAAGNWSQTGFAVGATYRVTPLNKDLSFSPASRDFSSSNSALNFTAVANAPFSASGLVTNTSGLAISGVTLTFTIVSGTGAVPVSVLTGTTGKWSQTGFSAGTIYRVTPSRTGMIFAPPSRDFSSGTSALDFTGSTSFSGSGQVVNSAGGSGVPGVTMTFTLVSGKGKPPAAVLTDATGRWSQSGFLAGNTYRVTPGLQNFSFSPTSLDFNTNNTALNFTAVSLLFAVSGKVSDSNGLPLAGVTVTFSRVSGKGTAPKPIQTGTDGRWSTGQVFAGGSVYRVTPSKAGITFVPISRDFSSSSSALDFTGITTFTGSGQVIDSAGGFGIAGVMIDFKLVSGSGAIISSVTTDAAGKWSQTGFTVGATYGVAPIKTGLKFSPSARNFSANNSALNFTAIASVSFSASGRVVDSNGLGIAGVKMTFSVISGKVKPPASVLTDANGNWSLVGGFTAGIAYRVTPSKVGVIFTPASRDFSSSTSALNFTGSMSFSGSGQVVDNAGGFGIPGVMMIFTIFKGSGNIPAQVTTDASGKWSQTGFTAGVTYRVTPSKAGLTFTPNWLDFSANNTTLNFTAKAIK